MATAEEEKTGRDRRKATRSIAFFRTEVSYKRKFYVGYIVNVSLTGCAFAHENLTSIAVGGRAKIKFRMNGKIVNTAVVVRWRDNTVMGLEFESLTGPRKKLLRDYIRTVGLRRIPL